MHLDEMRLDEMRLDEMRLDEMRLDGGGIQTTFPFLCTPSWFKSKGSGGVTRGHRS